MPVDKDQPEAEAIAVGTLNVVHVRSRHMVRTKKWSDGGVRDEKGFKLVGPFAEVPYGWQTKLQKTITPSVREGTDTKPPLEHPD